MSEGSNENGEADEKAIPPSANSGWPGKGLVGWFVDNPVAANLLMILFLAGGFVTALTMPTEVFPTLSPGQVQVSVIYPGATPGDVEESVTRRIEESVLGIDGVERVRSVASEGRGTVTVELRQFADAQVVKDDVETAVDSIADFPPAEAEQVQVRVPQPVTTVLTLALTGPVSERTLREAGESVERELLSREGISTVNLRGVRQYEISISVSEDALRRYALSFNEVSQAVRAASLDLSGGEIRTASGDILLRTNARRETGEAFEDIILRSSATGARVRLGEVAEIRDGFQDESLISTFNGEPAVFVDVQIQGSEDLLQVRSSAVDWLETEANLPAGVSATIASDQSQVFTERVSLLARNAIIGFTLVFLLLVLMLDLRLAFWVAMGVPISFLGGFAHPPNVEAVEWWAREVAPRFADRPDLGLEDTDAGEAMLTMQVTRLVHEELRAADHPLTASVLVERTDIGEQRVETALAFLEHSSRATATDAGYVLDDTYSGKRGELRRLGRRLTRPVRLLTEAR